MMGPFLADQNHINHINFCYIFLVDWTHPVPSSSTLEPDSGHGGLTGLRADRCGELLLLRASRAEGEIVSKSS